MASKIRIHRSTGASAPSSLEFGELAATVEQGTAGNSANKAGRLFIGNVAGNPVEIGGEYTYKLLDHTPGELHLTSALVTDANANINGLRIAGIATITRTDITDAVTQNLRVTGVGTFVAGLDLNGNVTIGNQHTDILTINSRTGVSTDMTLNNGLKVVGLSTFSNSVDINATTAFGDDVTFETANGNNIVFDKSVNDLTFGDSVKAIFGTHNDLQIYHDGSNSYIQHGTVGNLRYQSGNHDFYNQAGNEFMCRMFQNNSVNLYWDGNLRFHTHEHGIVTTGGSNNVHIYLRTSDGTQRGEVYANNSNQVGFLDETGNWAVSFDRNGTSYNFSHFVPGTNNTHDLGSTSYRWRNIYTSDLNMSNEGSSNDVDGTWGSYTIQEGAEDLYLINKRNGKKYKFALTEVS